MNTDDFHYEEQGTIARITLNRPEVLNAITFEIYERLLETFAALPQRRHLRVVVLTGAGRAFCTGGDVRSIIGRLADSTDKELLAFTKMTCDVVLKMREAPQPIIAALNGTTAGAGAALALASDIRIAAESAQIAFLFVKVGLSGADMGAAHLLPRLIGLTRATEMLMRGEFIDARTAEQWGLYNRVVPPESFAAAVQSWASDLAAGPQEGLEVTKKMLNRGLGFDLADALDVEAREQARCMKHSDFREAYDAFVQKRKPAFKGAP